MLSAARGGILVLLFLAVGSLVRAQAPANQSVSPSPAEALGGLTINVQQLRHEPALKLFPWEVVDAAGLDSMGFSFAIVEKVDVFMLPPPRETFAAVLHLSEASSAEKLKSDLLDMENAQEIAGKKVYPFQSDSQIALTFVSPKQIVVGNPEAVTATLTAKPGSGPVSQQLARLGGSGHLVAAVIPKTIEQRVTQELNFLPPEMREDVKVLFQKITLIAARSQVDMNVNIPLVIETANESDAQAVEASWNRLTNVLLSQVDQMAGMYQQDGQEDPIKLAQAKYVQRMRADGQKMLTPTRKGSRLMLVVNNDTVNMVRGLSTFQALDQALGNLQLSGIGAPRDSAPVESLKQIGLAFHNYESAYKRFPSAGDTDPQNRKQLSWRVMILPFIEQNALYNQFKLDEPWDSEHNIKLLEIMPSIYIHPNAQLKPGYTVFQMPTGTDLFGEVGKPTKLASITDGTSTTIMIAMSTDEAAVPWTKPEDFNPLENLKVLRVDGKRYMFGLADGSVVTYPETLPAEGLEALLTRNRGEIAPQPTGR